LSLPDALPIWGRAVGAGAVRVAGGLAAVLRLVGTGGGILDVHRFLVAADGARGQCGQGETASGQPEHTPTGRRPEGPGRSVVRRAGSHRHSPYPRESVLSGTRAPPCAT